MSNLTLPKKLNNDSLREALVEIRFESGELPEIVIGRLSDYSIWKSWSKRRLPSADIPAAIREANPDLRFQPDIEISNESKSIRIRIGGNSISVHNIGKYCGWDTYKIEIENVINALFEKFENIKINRFGLRYINAMTKEHHHIGGVSDLNLGITIGRTEVEDHINLSYFNQKETVGIIVKVVSPLFIQAITEQNTSVVIDLDVFSLEGYEETNKTTVMSQIEVAHMEEKEAFFALLPQTVIEKLKEE